MSQPSSPRIVCCECCAGEGRIYHGTEDHGWSEPCDQCDGTGGEIIETQPIGRDDLDIPEATEEWFRNARLEWPVEWVEQYREQWARQYFRDNPVTPAPSSEERPRE